MHKLLHTYQFNTTHLFIQYMYLNKCIITSTHLSIQYYTPIYLRGIVIVFNFIEYHLIEL